MRILADENIPRVIVTALRDEGHDVFWIIEAMPGIHDHEVLLVAENEQRLIITFDLDFGEMVFRQHAQVPNGLVLLRILLLSPEQIAQIVTRVLASRDDWSGHYSVIDQYNIRMIKLTR